jgi:hypothetical protein
VQTQPPRRFPQVVERALAALAVFMKEIGRRLERGIGVESSSTAAAVSVAVRFQARNEPAASAESGRCASPTLCHLGEVLGVTL